MAGDLEEDCDRSEGEGEGCGCDSYGQCGEVGGWKCVFDGIRMGL